MTGSRWRSSVKFLAKQLFQFRHYILVDRKIPVSVAASLTHQPTWGASLAFSGGLNQMEDVGDDRGPPEAGRAQGRFQGFGYSLKQRLKSKWYATAHSLSLCRTCCMHFRGPSLPPVRM